MAVDVTRCAWLLLALLVVLSSTSCSPSDPRFEKRAVGPVSVLREDEYRYGTATFYAESGGSEIRTAIIESDGGESESPAQITIPGHDPVSLSKVDLPFLRELFPEGEERMFAGADTFSVSNSDCRFTFRKSLDHVRVREGSGIQVSLGEKSAKVTIPCTVNELRQAFGEPDEIKLAK